MTDDKKVGFENFLEGIFEECNRCRIDKNLVSWYDLLVVATLNLSTEMSEVDLNFCVELKSRLLSEIHNLDKDNSLMETFIVPEDLERELFNWEIKLRKIRRDAGLQHNIKVVRGRFT